MPTSTRAFPVSAPSRMIFAALSGVIRASFLSKRSSIAAASSPAFLRPLREMPVLMPPGCTQVTVTGWPATSISSRIASVKPRTAYFVALYADWPGTEISPNSEETLTIAPSPEPIRWGRNSLVPCTTPMKLMPTIQSKSSYVMCSKSPVAVTPALLTTRLTRPNWSATAAAHVGHRGAVGDVDDVAAHLARAGTLDQVDGLGEALGVPVGEGQQRAGARRAQGERAADAGAGAGDDDDLVGDGLQAHAGAPSVVRLGAGQR